MAGTALNTLDKGFFMMFLIDILITLFEKIGIKGRGGFWGQLIGAGISAYGAAQKSKKSGGEITKFEPREYEEANKARGLWLQNLEKWGGEEAYGAIAPNWDEIWENARNKVRGFWQGSSTTTGALDKIRAESAKRRTTGGPGMQKLMLAAAAEQGEQLKGMSVDQALSRAGFMESGRQNWLSSVQGLASQRAPQPTYMQEPTEYDSSGGNALMGLGGGISNFFGARDQRKWIEAELAKTANSGAGTGTGAGAGAFAGGGR